jgi:hypothetical protein
VKIRRSVFLLVFLLLGELRVKTPSMPEDRVFFGPSATERQLGFGLGALRTRRALGRSHLAASELRESGRDSNLVELPLHEVTRREPPPLELGPLPLSLGPGATSRVRVASLRRLRRIPLLLARPRGLPELPRAPFHLLFPHPNERL